MNYQVLVIGSGPGGYVAAIRAAQLGFKTAIVEKYATLGGTCLNVGCIPSKALLDSSEHYHNAEAHFKAHGIVAKDLKLDFKQMIARKAKLVGEICQGVDYLMKKNKITVYHGHGSFIDPHTVRVTDAKKKVQDLKSEHIIIATGSKPSTLPFIQLDKERIITSTEALSLSAVPQQMAVIGGGVIGMEMGSVYARLGTKLSVIEYMPRLIPTMDETMGKELQRALIPLDIAYYLSHKVVEVKRAGKKVEIRAEGPQGKKVEMRVDYCLVSVGRRPYAEGLGLEKVGISLDKAGCIPVNDHLQTAQPHIYAIGDVIRGAMLAHKAEEEGILVAEKIAGQKPHIHYLLIPNVVYTWPEVAGVGYTEAEVKEKGIAYKKGSFPFKALGRARASGDTEGLVKVLARKDNDEILGVHIIGARAADMIAQAVLAMEYRASAEDVARTSHAHPTYMEAVKEACLAATENRALHI